MSFQFGERGCAWIVAEALDWVTGESGRTGGIKATEERIITAGGFGVEGGMWDDE
ncbi:hypothetical protein WN55_01181 [Dufourea novaeangliae]|uniref:Uncharacterized protein n=1 Tax=Dufourea novaeangliae TaxID=178035 RepID=A0A154PFV3_DUFNO|nr:hypothetical protein WN55_01181 [Dufourea novaeangliae]